MRLVAGRFALAALMMSALGCQDYFFEIKEPEQIKEAQVVVPAARPVPADILFVVDNSCSMEDEQGNLGTNFDAFIREIAGKGDYRIAIVSTDVGPGREKVGLRISEFKQAAPFTLVDINDDACGDVAIEHGCFRGPGTIETRVITSTLPADQQIALFNQNVALGSCGDGREAGLRAMQLALQQTGNGECNEGFLRQGANLVIVFVSDENDDDLTGTDVRNYVNFLKSMKDPSQIRVAAIVGAVDGTAENCSQGGGACGGTCGRMPPAGSGRACMNSNQCDSTEYCDRTNRCENRDLQFFGEFCHWCSYFNSGDCCSALAGHRYVDFLQQIEREVAMANPAIDITGCQAEEGKRIACLLDSVCQQNFSETLAKIARDLVRNVEYVLNPPACNPQGVVVRISGEDLVNGTDYVISEDGRILTLTGRVPSEDEQIEMFFVVEGC